MPHVVKSICNDEKQTKGLLWTDLSLILEMMDGLSDNGLSSYHIGSSNTRNRNDQELLSTALHYTITALLSTIQTHPSTSSTSPSINHALTSLVRKAIVLTNGKKSTTLKRSSVLLDVSMTWIRSSTTFQFGEGCLLALFHLVPSTRNTILGGLFSVRFFNSCSHLL